MAKLIFLANIFERNDHLPYWLYVKNRTHHFIVTFFLNSRTSASYIKHPQVIRSPSDNEFEFYI